MHAQEMAVVTSRTSGTARVAAARITQRGAHITLVGRDILASGRVSKSNEISTFTCFVASYSRHLLTASVVAADVACTAA